MKTVAVYNPQGRRRQNRRCGRICLISLRPMMRSACCGSRSARRIKLVLPRRMRRTTAPKNVLQGGAAVSRLVTPSPYENLQLIPADFRHIAISTSC